MTDDVFEHDDGVIDDKSHREDEGHEREIVHAESEQIHHAERADDRERDGRAGDEGGAHIAQEDENHEHDQRDREHQRELDIVQGFADRSRAVVEDIELEAAGKLRLKVGRSSRMRSITCDGVRARLTLDGENDAARLVVPAEVFVVLDAVDDAWRFA